MPRTLAVACGASVLIALGGTGGAYAARLIGSEQIADNSVRSVDVRDGDLGVHDLAPGIRTTLDTALTGYEVRWLRTILPGHRGSEQEERLECPAGKVALGGGQITFQAHVLASFPATNEQTGRATGWIWWIDPNVPEDSEADVWLYVTCANG